MIQQITLSPTKPDQNILLCILIFYIIYYIACATVFFIEVNKYINMLPNLFTEYSQPQYFPHHQGFDAIDDISRQLNEVSF